MVDKTKIYLLLFVIIFNICLFTPLDKSTAQSNLTTLRVGQTKNIDLNADNKFDLQVEAVKINPDGQPVLKFSRLPYQNYVYTINFMDYLTSLYTNMVIASTILSLII